MKTENIAEIIGAILAGIFTFYFYTKNETVFALIACIVAFLLLYLFLRGILNKEEPYIEMLNKILRTYDSILVEIECFPKLDDKKIVKAKYFKDLVNVQFDLRKPIYYYKEEECCNFLIINSNTAYVYVLKKSNEYTSKLELLLETQKNQFKKFEIIENFDIQKNNNEKTPELKEETTTEEIKEEKNDENNIHSYRELNEDEKNMVKEVMELNNQNIENEVIETQDIDEDENNQYYEEQFTSQPSDYEVVAPTIEKNNNVSQNKKNKQKKNKQLTIEKYEIDHVNKKTNKSKYNSYDDTMANLSADELDKQFEDLLSELNDLDVD